MSSRKRGKGAAEPPSSQKKRRESGRDEDPSSPFAWTPSGVQVLLPAGRRLVFHGRATLTVHSGEVEIAGRVLSARDGATELRTDAFAPLAVSVASTEARVPLAGTGGAAFSLAGGAPDAPTFDVALEGDADALPPQDLPEAWLQAAAGIAESVAAGLAAGAPPPVIAVCGAKKVGKSTFARYLTNVLLNNHPRVAYLDTDCGQPEFTPPGLVSLTLIDAPVAGPPHLHQRRPAAAHFIGDVSPATDPPRYLACVASLYDWYRKNDAPAGSRTPPLVVNAHGWVKGLGFDLLVDTLRGLPVTHFVHLMAPNQRKNLPQGVFWAGPPGEGAPPPAPLFFDLPALGGGGMERASSGVGFTASEADGGDAGGTPSRAAPAPAAVEQRALHWVEFAQSCVEAAARESGVARAEGCEEIGDALAAAPPFEVALSDFEVRLLHGAVPPSQLAYALNGAIVGLCGSAEAPDAPAPCLGLGIVRAADGGAGRLLLLTPLGAEELDGVVALEVGRLELPTVLLQTARLQSPYLALHSLSAAGTGAGAIKSRNNLLRAGQL